MKPRFFPLSIALLLSAGAFAAGPPSARNLPGLMPAPEFAVRHASDIGLSAAQQARIESDTRDMEGEAQKLIEQARIESDALAQLLAHDPPDDAAVAVQFDKVLATEDAVKRLRLKISLRTRAVLTADQRDKLAALQNVDAPRRAAPPEEQELAAKMQRVQELIVRAKAEGRDLSSARAMWNRIGQLTQEGKTAEAMRILDDTAKSLEAGSNAPSEPR
jgi:Spy/CpxP family protein refolding chaperone